jgi:hypothetical protein
MKKGKKSLFLVLAVVIAAGFVLGLPGCANWFGSEDEAIAILGEWLIDGAYPEQWAVTETSITYSSDYGSGLAQVFSAEIVSFSNTGFNAGDTTLISTGMAVTGAGYAVIKYTEVDNPGTGEVGKYNIFRWAANAADDAKRDFIQGYTNVGNDWPANVNGVFDTASAAKSGAANAAGYFTYPSIGAAKQ